MSIRPGNDTDGIAVFNAARAARIAPPALCAERVLQAVQDGRVDREMLADYFDIAASNFTLRRILCELADAGLIVLVPDEAGYDDYTIRLAGRRANRRAA